MPALPGRQGAPLPVEAPAPRHLRVVPAAHRSPAARRRRTRRVVVVASLAALAVAFGLVYLHVVSAQKQFRLDDLNVREAQSAQAYEQLRVEVQSLDAPAHIMSAALRLGMRVPGQVTTVVGIPGGTYPPLDAAGVVGGAAAPGGAADWSATKSELAGP